MPQPGRIRNGVTEGACTTLVAKRTGRSPARVAPRSRLAKGRTGEPPDSFAETSVPNRAATRPYLGFNVSLDVSAVYPRDHEHVALAEGLPRGTEADVPLLDLGPLG